MGLLEAAHVTSNALAYVDGKPERACRSWKCLASHLHALFFGGNPLISARSIVSTMIELCGVSWYDTAIQKSKNFSSIFTIHTHSKTGYKNRYKTKGDSHIKHIRTPSLPVR